MGQKEERVCKRCEGGFASVCIKDMEGCEKYSQRHKGDDEVPARKEESIEHDDGLVTSVSTKV